MKKITILFVLLSFFSCAAVTEYQKVYRQELQQRDNELFGPPPQSSLSSTDDSTFALLLGLYAFSLAKNPPKYPLYPYSPYLFSPYYPFDSFHDLMVYESMLESINRRATSDLDFEALMFRWHLETATQEAKRKLESTMDDLEEATKREETRLEEAARKLENERWRENHERTLNYLLAPEKKATFETALDEVLKEMWELTFRTPYSPPPPGFVLDTEADATPGLPFLNLIPPKAKKEKLIAEAEATGRVGAGAVATTQAPELRKKENLID